MLVLAHFPLLLLLLGVPQAGLSHRSYKAKPLSSCIDVALVAATKSQLEDAPLLSKRSFPYLPGQDPSSGEDEEKEEEEADKGKRTFSGSGGGGRAGSTQYKYLSQGELRGRLYRDKAKSDRRAKFTLSLDVPTNIMNILFNIAKAKNLRAKAAANAHLMAQIGRKK
ncbi:urocortin-3 [Manis pentadactyla]|uniref:urocortin-3 n=1 Tax=Manis pentadactyla TaxID=143292 RepID=UPI001875AA0D|nr:urocortin-3 [Manis pentadactyla]